MACSDNCNCVPPVTTSISHTPIEGSCPRCGYCPCCGRGGYVPPVIYSYPTTWTVPYTITVSSGTSYNS